MTSSEPNHLPRAPPPSTIPLGLWLQCGGLGGTIQTVAFDYGTPNPTSFSQAGCTHSFLPDSPEALTHASIGPNIRSGGDDDSFWLHTWEIRQVVRFQNAATRQTRIDLPTKKEQSEGRKRGWVPGKSQAQQSSLAP